MNVLRVKTNGDLIAAPVKETYFWINALVELNQPPPEQLAQLDRGQRYTLLADRTRQQRAELEMWLDAAEIEDQVMAIYTMEAMGVLLVQCTPAAAARLKEAPGVADVTITGLSAANNGPTTLQLADA